MNTKQDIRKSISIHIDGDESGIKYSNLSIHQALLEHHTFSFSWHLDTDNSIPISDREQEARNLLGKKIEFGFGATSYNYVITSSRLVADSSGSFSIEVVGASPTILIDDMAVNQIYVESSISDAINDTSANVPSDMLKGNISPTHSATLPLIMQKQETDWEFAQRLCVRHGEWMFYDGAAMHVGDPLKNGPTVEHGKDLRGFSINSKIVSPQFAYITYDAEKGETNEGKAKGANPPGGNDFLKQSTQTAKDLYRKPDKKKLLTNAAITADEMKAYEDLKERATFSNSVEAYGETICQNLRLGQEFTAQFGDSEHKLIVVDITHYSDSYGKYANSFVAIPAGLQFPPYTNPDVAAPSGSEPAKVVDTSDPAGLGRIKVAFLWNEDVHTPWLRVSTTSGGEGKGFFIIPEIGEEVLVDYENDNGDKPYVAGAMYHGQAKPGHWTDGENNVKAIRTRGGHELIFNDEDGQESITIQDKEGNRIHFDTKEKIITIEAPDEMIFKSKIIKIEAEEELLMSANDKAELSSKETLVEGTQKVDVTSSSEVNVSATNTTVSASAALKLESSAQTDLSSSGITNVKGSLVKLN